MKLKTLICYRRSDFYRKERSFLKAREKLRKQEVEPVRDLPVVVESSGKSAGQSSSEDGGGESWEGTRSLNSTLLSRNFPVSRLTLSR